MNDEQYTPALGSWLKDTDITPPDPYASARQIMTGLPEREKRRNRWAFNRHTTPIAPPTTDQTIEYQPAPIPALNGHTPTVLGRTHSMLSPVKAITAGAILFAIGGAFLIAQPFQQPSSVPGAEAEAIAPTWVTGTVERSPACTSGSTAPGDGAIRLRDVECSPQTWTSSDRRLTGEVSRLWNEDSYLTTDEGYITVSRDLASLRNDGGGWACTATDLVKGLGSNTEEMAATTYTCFGEDGYDGLSALLVSEQGPNYSEDFVGLVFSGDLPPLPEAPAAE